MARTLEDVLARRTRALFLDTGESLKIAAPTAELMAKGLDKNEEWISRQIDDFQKLSQNYLVD
jgi:glycerol-3-phosphate dehydrogenase